MSVAMTMRDLIFGFEVPETWRAYLDQETGMVYNFDEDLMAKANDAEKSDRDDNDFETDHDWDEEAKVLARLIVSDFESKRFVALPTPFDFHEYRRMEEFIDQLAEGEIRRQLAYSIRGRSAFRRFKDAAHRLDVIDDWYAYREKALTRLISRWARLHDVLIADAPPEGGD
jgi:hypothetical protein